MSFIQPCFIRKNTPELCKRLRRLGYHRNFLDDNNGEWLAVNHGMFISVNEGFQNLPFDDIDSGKNEKLFIALAALRDDNDYLQWFVSNKKEWLLCEKHKWYQGLTTFEPREWHKATVEELIEHFKTK